MKTLQLTIDDNLYDTLLALLKGLPKNKIKIIEDSKTQIIANETSIDINQFAGKIKSFAAIKDPVAWQREIRSEWDDRKLYC